MKILQIHNRYKEVGGEDIVVDREKNLLESADHTVLQFFASNSDIKKTKDKIYTALQMSYNLKYKKLITKLLVEEQPDIIHIHNFLPILSPSIFYAANKEKIPIVVTLHNFRLICINGLLYRDNSVCEDCISTKIAIGGIKHGCYQNSKIASLFPTMSNSLHSFLKTWQSKIEKVILMSEFSKSVFSRSHVLFKEKQIVIKPNFVDDKGYSFEKEDYYLFVGRISEEKGILTITESFIDSGKKIKIAGTGPLQEALKEYSEIHQNIEYLGFQTQDHLKELYLKAKATIFASKMYEGNPLVLLESFSFGTPVIVPDFGNAGDLITEGYNGNKYIAGDTESLTLTVHAFESNKNQKTLRKGARNTFEEKYTAKKNLQKLEEVYQNAIDEYS